LSDEKNSITVAEPKQPDLIKKIDKITYLVNVHFNQNSTETMSDKIIRMLRNEVTQNSKI